MAIFSKKQNHRKPDDQQKVIVDSSLEAKPAEETMPKEAASTSEPVPEPIPSPPAPVTAPARHNTAEVEPEPVTPPVVATEKRFGIDDAIALMRTLPTDSNAALVVRVVRATLGAVHVSIEEIVEDAVRKEARIKESIATLETQIVDLDKQLGILRREISTQQADLKETANVRERLHMADQLPGLRPPPPPPSLPTPRATGSKPIVS